jgi:hypothetical protein
MSGTRADHNAVSYMAMRREGYPDHVEKTLRALKGGHQIELDGLDSVSRAALAKLRPSLLPKLESEWKRIGLGFPNGSLIESVAACLDEGTDAAVLMFSGYPFGDPSRDRDAY